MRPKSKHWRLTGQLPVAEAALWSMRYRLDALNFFLADVRGGLGAFVGVFLVTTAGWTAGEVGAVLTVSGLVGIMALAPVGAAIDVVRAKRGMEVVGLAGSSRLAPCNQGQGRPPSPARRGPRVGSRQRSASCPSEALRSRCHRCPAGAHSTRQHRNDGSEFFPPL